MNTGIYTITNEENGKVYVGSSINISKRWRRHLWDLRKKQHHNCRLQGDFDTYGKNVFTLKTIEPASENLKVREDYWIERLNSKCEGYNIGDANFGDTLTHHPDRDSRIAKITETMRSKISSMSEEEIKEKYARHGKDNYNYKPEIQRFCDSCNGELSYSTRCRRGKTCGVCRDRTGEKNPFYGKTHSKEVRLKLSKASKGVRRSSDKVFAEGLAFEAMVDCARHFKISNGLVTYRVKSPKYPTWYKE